VKKEDLERVGHGQYAGLSRIVGKEALFGEQVREIARGAEPVRATETVAVRAPGEGAERLRAVREKRKREGRAGMKRGYLQDAREEEEPAIRRGGKVEGIAIEERVR
jgi:hypothetical protein